MASIFSGKAGRNAAMAANNVLAQGLKQASDHLTEGKNNAAGYLNRNPAIYQNSFDNSMERLNKSYGDAQSFYQGASDTLRPFYDTGRQANTAYSNAMGLNGAEGYNQALQNFRAGPGYQFQVDQGLDAINRTAAARGGLASGNNTVDLLHYAQGQADQSWTDYMSALNNQVNAGLQAANGISSSKQGLGALAMNYGNQSSTLTQNLGNQLAGTNTALANNEMGGGEKMAGHYMNAYNQMAQNTGQGMMAGQTAAGNRFGALMGGINAGLGFLGSL